MSGKKSAKAETSRTEITRFNALRHGVLSRYTVLPWEDAAEYHALVAALVAEHAPQGPTEEHLVDELAGILWRKRRLRVAEAAAHRRGLEEALEVQKRHCEGGRGASRGHRLLDTEVVIVEVGAGSVIQFLGREGGIPTTYSRSRRRAAVADCDRESRKWAGKRALPGDTYRRGVRPNIRRERLNVAFRRQPVIADCGAESAGIDSSHAFSRRSGQRGRRGPRGRGRR